MFFIAPLIALLAPGAVTDTAAREAPPAEAPTRDPAPSQPVAPAAPVDPTTGQPIPARDATGQPVIQLDETGQPIVKKDESGQIAPSLTEDENTQRADSFLRNGRGMMLDENERERLRDGLLGGHDWRAQIALVEGYNTNVIQTQQVAGGPATPHPSPYTGIDASLEWLKWSSIHDQQSLRIQVRGQQYEPLNGYSQPDDGSVNAGWNGQYTLGPRTYVQGRVLVTVSTVNSARLDDGPLFQLNPGDVQRTYTLENARFTVVHELSDRTRWVTGADVDISTTIRDEPIVTDTGAPFYHRGLDYVNPGFDTSLFHDFDDRNIGSVTLRYDPTYIAFLENVAVDPPAYNGRTTIEAGELDVAWVHAFTDRFRSATTVGLSVTSAPPFDPDTRPIESPLFAEELTYIGNYWSAVAAVTYSYGSANPRLGFGPSAGATASLQGVPFPHGTWRNLSFIALGLANRSVFEEAPNALSRLSFTEGSLELRYGVNNWLGLIAGYDFRYATFEGVDAFPSLTRHIVFAGFSGYWATDRTIPTLDTFVSPIKPPG